MTPWHVIRNGRRRQESLGLVARLTFDGVAGPRGLTADGQVFTETFAESIGRAAAFAEANEWWPAHGAVQWRAERQPPGVLPELDGHSMALSVALGLARFAIHLWPAVATPDLPIDRCDLQGVVASAELVPGNPRRPALQSVCEMQAKWAAVQQYAEVLGITAFIVAAAQTGLPGEPQLVGGFPVGSEYTHVLTNPVTGNRWPLVVIRAVDVADAITRLARAQGRNLIAV